MSKNRHNPLKKLEASTGIEPVYTDLQSAASPLRQLASLVVCQAVNPIQPPAQAQSRSNTRRMRQIRSKAQPGVAAPHVIA